MREMQATSSEALSIWRRVLTGLERLPAIRIRVDNWGKKVWLLTPITLAFACLNTLERRRGVSSTLDSKTNREYLGDVGM